MAALSTLTVALLQLADLVYAQPTLYFPLNAQLPPAARIDEFFTYSFSQDTFGSADDISYSLGQNHPSWLSLESESRRLYGTPKSDNVGGGDIVGQKVDIVATDKSGSTAMNSTIVVSKKPAPEVEIPLEVQMEGFGNYSAPSSILSYPSTDFTYSFDPDTFGKDKDLNYYAVSADNSPLPAWVQFDPSTLTFSGKTPPFESLIQPPQTFGLNLVASDIVGFSGSTVAFSIVVGSHKLSAAEPIISLNATKGSKLSYDGLKNGISLDQKPINPGDLQVTLKDLPDWLSYDTDTGVLSGTPGESDHSSNFTITYVDKFADSLDVLVMVNVATGLFKSTFENMEARPGGEFNVDLAPYFRNPDDIKLTVDVSPRENWLKVDGFKLLGDVPKSATGDFEVSIKAQSKSSDLSETETLKVTFLAKDGTPTTSGSKTSTTPSATSTGKDQSSDTADADAANGKSGRLNTGDILLATIIPILFIALVLMLMVCFLRRKRARRNYLSTKARSKISHPVLGTLRVNGLNSSVRKSEKMMMSIPYEKTEKHTFKPTTGTYVDAMSRGTTARPRSSETLGNNASLSVPTGLVAANFGPRESAGTGRQSWETVEGDAALMMSGGKSAISHRSDTTISESTHQLFSADHNLRDTRDGYAGLSFGLHDANHPLSMHPAPLAPYKKPGRAQQSFGGCSTITTSSVALPMNERNRYMEPAPPAITDPNVSEPNWETLTMTDGGSIPELPKPEQALLTGKRTLDGKGWFDGSSSTNSQSVPTEPSFGSGENWRRIGQRDPTNLSYKDIGDETSFNSSRPGLAREGNQPGEQEGPEGTKPSKWGEVNAKKTAEPVKSSTTGMSATVSHWRHEDSGLSDLSNSSSFKVFL